MGHDATATLSEIEAARQRLQHDIDLLEHRTRRDLRQELVVMGSIAAASGVGVILAVVLARRGLHRRAEHRRAQRQAAVLADVLEEHGLASRPAGPGGLAGAIRAMTGGSGS